MGQQVKRRGQHSRSAPESDSHEDIAHLCHRGISDHPLQILLQNSDDAADQHAGQSENKQNVFDACNREQLCSENPVNDFHQQEKVGMGHQPGHNRRAGRGCGSVSVRHPGMKGKKCAFDAQSDGDQTYHHDQRQLVLTLRRQCGHLLPDRGHQQVPRQRVRQHHAQQEQP